MNKETEYHQFTYRNFHKFYKEKKENFKNTNDLLNFYKEHMNHLYCYKLNTQKRIEKINKKITKLHEQISKQLDCSPIFVHKTDKKVISKFDYQIEYTFHLHGNDTYNIQLTGKDSNYKCNYLSSYSSGGYSFDCYEHLLQFNRKFIYENMDNLIVDHMILLKKEQTEHKYLYKCLFLKPKYVYSKRYGTVIDCFVEKTLYWYKNSRFSKVINAKNGKTAMAVVKKMKRKEAKLKLTERIMKTDLNKIDLSTVIVTKEDSIEAGNCKEGTENFMEHHNITHAIDAKTLLDLEDSTDTRRAVKHAIHRSLGKQLSKGRK